MTKAKESHRASQALDVMMLQRNRQMHGRARHANTYASLSLAYPHLHASGRRNRHVSKVRSGIHAVLEERMRRKALLDKNINIVLHNLHLLVGTGGLHKQLEIHAERDRRTLTHNHNQHHVENNPHWENIEEENEQFEWQDLEGPREIILDIEHIDVDDGIHIYGVTRRDRFSTVLGPADHPSYGRTVKSILEQFMGGRNRYHFTHLYLTSRGDGSSGRRRTEIPIAK